MDLSYLREFITFSEYMNVSEAARRIHMAQPTLSHHIASVEKEVGCRSCSLLRLRRRGVRDRSTTFAC